MSAQCLETQDPACRHCGSVVTLGQAYCCSGCETAHAIISGGGWQAYYDVRNRENARPVAQPSQSFDYLDSSDFHERYTQPDRDQRSTTLFLDGLRCGACSWLVEQVARAQPGVQEASLHFAEARLSLRFTEQAQLSDLAYRFGQLGYTVGLVPHGSEHTPRTALRLGITGALAGNLMLMSLPFYAGLDPGPTAQIFGWIAFLLAIPVLIYGGREYFVRAALAVRYRLPGLDLPIAIGLAGAFGLSTYNLINGHVHGLYFDSMGMLVFFLLLGRTAREAGITRAFNEARRLLARMPQLVDTYRDGRWLSLPAAQIVPGDLLRLRSGDVLAVDAHLVSSEAILNLHVVSGESQPVTVHAGNALLAGSINLGAAIEVRASSCFSDSRFAQLEQTAHGLRERKPGAAAGAAAWYFLAFALSAAVLAAVYGWSTSPVRGMTAALTVLIVVCPCALALARPLADAFALRQAAAIGAWVKDIDLFQRLRQIRKVVFDKTGILTDGEARIFHRATFVANPHWLEAAIAALEEQVHHPLVTAFAQARGPRPAIVEVRDVRVLPGAGLAGWVDGHHVIVASPARLAEFGVSPKAQHQFSRHAEGVQPYLTQVAVLLDGAPAAFFGLADRIRDEAPALVADLRARHLDLTILSGDRDAAVSRVGEAIGIEHQLGHMLPEQKLAYLQNHEPERTLMVGDGFNDMGALARAAIGVTHAAGAEAALRFSDVIFRDRELRRLSGLFALADTNQLAMRLGTSLSLCYNLFAVTLAVQGAIGPLGAALLMPLSSLSLLGMQTLVFHWRRRTWVS